MAIAVPLAAQTLPGGLQNTPAIDPERINEEQRRRLEARIEAAPVKPDATVETIKPPVSAVVVDTSFHFKLTAIEVGPSAYLEPSAIAVLTAPLIGHEVGFNDLQHVVDGINALYAKRGAATAQAVLPAQTIAGGVVKLTLVEGKIGKVAVNGGSARAQQRVAKAIGFAAGSLADPRLIESGLRRFNRDNDAQLKAQLAVGASFGTTDLMLVMVPPRRLQIDAFADNNGFESTGKFEQGAILRAYRLLGSADRLSLVGVRSEGVATESASYSAPVGGDRFRFDLSASHGLTRVRHGQGADLGIRGNSITYGGDVAGLIIANAATALTATAGVQQTLSSTDIAGKRVVDSLTRTETGGLALSFALPGLSLGADASIVVAQAAEHLSGETRHVVLARGSLFAAKGLGNGLQARLRSDWQYAKAKALPGVLEYQIGGAHSVRAFAPGIAAGDRGVAVSGELAWDHSLGKLLIEPFLFIDDGQVGSVTGTTSLQDAGAGVLLAIGPRVAITSHYARSLGHQGLTHGDERLYATITVHL